VVFALGITGLILAGLVEPSIWLSQHRYDWYALPIVMLTFVGLPFMPVTLLTAATGLAFGPFLGPVYAMAGCLTSASTCFALGRWLGPSRLASYGGERLERVTGALRANGVLAVFLIRKVPAPFALVNIAVGASPVRYRDFLLGSFLGLCGMVIALAGLGYQLTEAWREPSPQTITTVLAIVSVPLFIAWWLNRTLRRAEPQV
jgi:phospholipase D1/2